MIPWLGISPGEGKGYPLWYSGLDNSMDCIVHGVAKSWTRLSSFHFQKSCSIIFSISPLMWIKSLLANTGDAGSILGSGRSLGGGNGNPLQYCCLKNSLDRGAWWATAHGPKATKHTAQTHIQERDLRPYLSIKRKLKFQ